MDVIIACESSGKVRDELRKRGHNAVSCDILPSDAPGPHIQGDIRDVDLSQFDMMIAHPPCTYLTVAGALWFYHPEDKHLPVEERRPHPRYPNRRKDQEEALDLVRYLLDAPVERIALENPISVISSRIRKPDQIIQPWMFGHGETKATCLWLKNLPKLQPTKIVEGRENRVHKLPPSKDRWKIRSETYQGIAEAMADQWGQEN